LNSNHLIRIFEIFLSRGIENSLKEMANIIEDDIGVNEEVFEIPNYNWNIFRYIADYLHLAGILILIVTLIRNRNCKGLSLKTQLFYFLVFITRYLDLLEHKQTFYLVFFKLTYILTSFGTLGAFWFFNKQNPDNYESQKDTASVTGILVPCVIAAFVLSKYKNFLEIAWTFSEYLEGFAMVPQYIFCYRESAATLMRGQGILVYICALGGYRVFYALNWLYKFHMDPTYRDPQSWIGGMLEILFFADFLSYQFQHMSILRSMVLTIDDKVNEVVEAVELKAFPNRAEGSKTGGENGGMRRRNVVGNQQEYSEVVAMQEVL